ncbi:CPBP family intramembrane metalloprotease [Tabrizicola sp. TH137]|uniref:CPBP family intramembrane glutamic endopeptidase n=1 Tax=Tabrizicola sp. TH137 TaxID=2067452 RepID=UPI000C7DB00C|nr:CPBP family intramembrane glutamic endopeptidase [Tabrizicola sp. TH137]PLL10997.1 CPBP family intramembrane metalloprotease [Tabrizicola sp. TH137]
MADTSPTAAPIWLRALQFPLTRLIVLGGGLFYFMGWTESRLILAKENPALGALIALALGLVAILLYIAWGRIIERREVTEVSTPGAGREFGIGLLIGVGLYSACVLILWLMGIYQVQGLNPVTFMIPAIAMAIKSGIFEELVFRGVLFKSLEDMAGSWIAIVISSAVFGFLHLLNPDGSFLGALFISIEAGLLLAAAYLVTRRLWICIGFHIGWNYVQSALYSGIVSGGVAEPGLLQVNIDGPTILTGGTFGMEQSILALVFCTLTGVILLMMAMQKGNLKSPPWSR